MKALFLTSISLFALAACTQQLPPSSSQGALSESDHGGGLSRQFDICVRRNLPGNSHPWRQRRWPRPPVCGPIHGMPAICRAATHDDR